MTISISGTVYSDGGTTPDLSGLTINVSVNGAASSGSATSSAVDGTYTVSGITAASGAVLTVYLQGNTPVGAVVATSTGLDMTGIDIYENYLNLRSDSGSALTGANLNTSDGNGDSGITSIYAAASNTSLVLASGISLCIMTGQTFAPGGSSQITVPGNWLCRGTFTKGSSTVTLTGASASGKITTNGNQFDQLKLNGAGGTYTLQDALTCASALTLTAGTLDVSASNYAISAGGTGFTSGVLVARSGTVTITGIGTIAGLTYYNLVAAGMIGPATGTVTVQNDVTISGAMGDNGNTIRVGRNWTNNGTFTSFGGTVVLNGSGDQTIAGSTTFTNLTATGGDRSIKFTDGTTQTVSGAVDFEGTSGHLLTLTGTSTGGWTIAMPASQTLQYVNPSYSTATGHTAAAGTGSTDGGHNTNWTFPAAGPPSGTMSMLGVGA